MNWDEIDLVVVGGGLAGALTVDYLSSRGKRIAWFDRQIGSSSSLTGAGIMNPITGRKFVYSWRFDQFLSEALVTYQALQTEAHQILHETGIVKGLPTPGDINNWCLRLGEPPYTSYMHEPVSAQSLPCLRMVEQLGLISPVYRVDMAQATQAVEAKWGKSHFGLLYRPRVLQTHAGMTSIPERLPVILAVGAPVDPVNGLDLPLSPYQGQALLIRSSDLPSDRIIHHKLKVVPYGGDMFWVGTYDQWDDLTEFPTSVGEANIRMLLETYFDIRYEVIGHLSGIRPAGRTRRPFAGVLPTSPNTFVINGLGTKGASLAPLMVKTLCDSILFHIPVPDHFSIPEG